MEVLFDIEDSPVGKPPRSKVSHNTKLREPIRLSVLLWGDYIIRREKGDE